MARVRQIRVGAHALLLECANGAEVEAWRAKLWRARAAGALRVAEIVPGARTVLLDGLDDIGAAADLLTGPAPTPTADSASAGLLEIPVEYGGEDLAAVAELWGATEADVVARISGTELTVAFCGFAPGWAYLSGLPAELAVPRLATPRPRVPAGSVALGGEYVGIYPNASPGGWRLIGHTDAALFDVDADPPALLTPGTRVVLAQKSAP
jgi:KipI family sensor histidine kinase inhibitor